MLAWSWRNGNPVLRKKKQDEAELTLIQSESGDKIVITRKDVTNAPKRLGVRVSADGNWKKEKMRWTRNAVVFAEKVRRAKFSRVCGWKVFSSIWCAKVRFVAGVFGLE